MSSNRSVANIFPFALCQRRSGEPVFAFWAATFCRTKVFDRSWFVVIFFTELSNVNVECRTNAMAYLQLKHAMCCGNVIPGKMVE